MEDMMNKISEDACNTLDFIETKTCNSDTSLLPLFIYNIIKNSSSYEAPLTTKMIIDKIADRDLIVDYNMRNISEKTIRRIIYTLIGAGTGVVFKKKQNEFYYTNLANHKF